jgi:hypothetical protein
MPETEITDFKDLIIWRKGMDIAEKCYFLTKLFRLYRTCYAKSTVDAEVKKLG